MPRAARRNASSALAQRLLRIGAARDERGHEADDQRGDDRDGGGERQHAGVQFHARPAGIEPRLLGGKNRAHGRDAPHGEQRSEESAGEREQQ